VLGGPPAECLYARVRWRVGERARLAVDDEVVGGVLEAVDSALASSVSSNIARAIASALGHVARRQGYHVRFARADERGPMSLQISTPGGPMSLPNDSGRRRLHELTGPTTI
jgi:hypothetical protein